MEVEKWSRVANPVPNYILCSFRNKIKEKVNGYFKDISLEIIFKNFYMKIKNNN